MHVLALGRSKPEASHGRPKSGKLQAEVRIQSRLEPVEILLPGVKGISAGWAPRS